VRSLWTNECLDVENCTRYIRETTFRRWTDNFVRIIQWRLDLSPRNTLPRALIMTLSLTFVSRESTTQILSHPYRRQGENANEQVTLTGVRSECLSRKSVRHVVWWWPTISHWAGLLESIASHGLISHQKYIRQDVRTNPYLGTGYTVPYAHS
jgi:hypothetical protein